MGASCRGKFVGERSDQPIRWWVFGIRARPSVSEVLERPAIIVAGAMDAVAQLMLPK